MHCDDANEAYIAIVADGSCVEQTDGKRLVRHSGDILGCNNLLRGADSSHPTIIISTTDEQPAMVWRIPVNEVMNILRPQGLNEVCELFRAYARPGETHLTKRDLMTCLRHRISGFSVADMKERLKYSNDEPNAIDLSPLRRKNSRALLRDGAEIEFQKIMTPLRPPHAALLNRLMNVSDKDNDRFVSFEDFLRINRLVDGKGGHFDVAFRLFDHDRSGDVSLEDIKTHLESPQRKERMGIPKDFNFDYSCDLIKQYFPNRTEKALRFDEFSSFFVHLEREIVRQQFNYYDQDRDGTISRHAFTHLALSKIFSSGMPVYVKNRLKNVFNSANVRSEDSVTFAEFSAFNDFLRHLPAIETAIFSHFEATGRDTLTRDELMNSHQGSARAQIKNFLCPLEIDLTWDVYDVSNDGFVSRSIVEDLVGVPLDVALRDRGMLIQPPENVVGIIPEDDDRREKEDGSIIKSILHFLSNFVLGGIAGGVGVVCVYPIDLVKTRMQNQRTPSTTVKNAQPMYRHSADCFVKVFRSEGFRGLYRGILPQLAGVSPEKAIKLATNDFLRGIFSTRDEVTGKATIMPALEIVSGMGAGASQVVFTNPVEIVKIRLQTAALLEAQHKAAGTIVQRHTAFSIIRQLGFRGLYKGASACFLRDIPFSAIYFPCYAFCKNLLAFETPDGKKELTPNRILVAGALAGIPAAYLVTPADVIKTRLQADAKAAGENARAYGGLLDAARTILKEEGFGAFFKGGLARICRSSPQFGVTLLTYELLHRYVAPVHSKRAPPTAVPLSDDDRRVLRHYPAMGSRLDHLSGRLGKVDLFE